MAASVRSKLPCLTRHLFIHKPFSYSLICKNAFMHRIFLHTSSCLDVKGQEIKMPSLSPTMSEGTIVKWLKKEGEAVVPGDVLCEIQTDKAVMSFETEEEGILAKILIPDNTKDVKVGSLIALMVAEGEDWQAVEISGSSTTSSLPENSKIAESEGNVLAANILMPSLSPTMTVGTITKWHKKEGERISPGDVLCDIQTDKAVMSFETEEEGVLAKILIPEGTMDIKVGTLIALMVGEEEDWTQVQVPSLSGVSEVESSTKIGTVPGVNISMPSLSPTMTEGTIVKWYKKEGDPVAAGDVLCDIQTDKAVMSFEIDDEGVVAKIMVPEGSSGVKVGTLIALMVGEGKNWRDVIVPSEESESKQIKIEKQDSKPAPKSKSQKPGNYGPAVRTLLDLYKLDSIQIKASGRNNKLLKSDVLEYIWAKKLQPQPPTSVPLPGKQSSSSEVSISASIGRPKKEKYVDIEVSSMRKTIAKRLTESKTTIPHAYAAVECNIDSLLSLRRQMKAAGIAASVNDFVIKAVALALKECPLVNCIYLNEQATPAPSIDISVAVATDAGLITPIIKNANMKSISEISAEIKDLAMRAKAGKLQLHEFQGGSFTISNLGMFGISEFSAIINPPQCGILAVGGGRSEIDFKGKPVTKMTSTLSFDARAISESAASDFLEMFQLLLENPANILVGSSVTRQRAVSNQ